MSEKFFYRFQFFYFLGVMDFCYIDSVFFFFLVHRFGQTISSTGASNLWPLVAVSHQMTVRDAAPLQEHSHGLISRIQGP